MSYNSMNKSDLKKLSKSELIKLLLKQEKKKPQVVIVDDTKPSKEKLHYPTISHPKKVQFAQTKTFIPKPKVNQPVLTSRNKVKKISGFF